MMLAWESLGSVRLGGLGSDDVRGQLILARESLGARSSKDVGHGPVVL